MQASIRRALHAGVLMVALAAGGPSALAAPQPAPGAAVRVGPHQGPMMRHGPGHHPGSRKGVMIQAAARYLGLTPSELRTQLRSGKSLAQIAASQGKSVEGLRQAMLAAVKTRLDQAVAAGTMTQAEAQATLSRFEQHIAQIINAAPQAPAPQAPAPQAPAPQASGG